MKHPETKMIALKAIRYRLPKRGQDRIAKGAEFYVRTKHVKILEELKHAKVAPRDRVALPEIPQSLVDKLSKPIPRVDDDIKAMREEYQAAFGKKPFNGWDAATLRAKIAEHSAEA